MYIYRRLVFECKLMTLCAICGAAQFAKLHCAVWRSRNYNVDISDENLTLT